MGAYIRCRKCGITKPESEFGFSDKAKGKRQTMCRSCFSDYNRKRYEANKEETKRRVSEYRRNNPSQVFKTRLKTYRKNPTDGNFYKLVSAAEKAGILVRPDRCQVCGQKPDKRLEAHHEDYSKPLAVIWCCTACHDKLDQERRIREGKPYHARVRPVLCLETGIVYPSISRAAKEVGLRGGNSISECLAGKTKTSGGFHWEYADGR